LARKKQEERPSWEMGNIGLTMFTTLMILLLAFFIVLSANSAIDEKRELRAIGSLIGSFGILPKGLNPNKDDKKHFAPSSAPLEEIKSDVEQMKEVLNYELNQEKINILKGQNFRVISLNETALFSRNGVQILPEMKPALMELADIMRNGDYSIIIEGHTDDQPPANEALINNWYVSSLRAADILRFFISAGRIAPSRLSAYGYASFRPAVVNNSPENRARNRRVDLILETTPQRAIYRYREKYRKPEAIIFKGFIFKLLGAQGDS